MKIGHNEWIYTVQGPGRAGSRPFFLALTLALRAGPPTAWPWPRVGLTPGQEGRARAGSGPTLTLEMLVPNKKNSKCNNFNDFWLTFMYSLYSNVSSMALFSS